MSDIFWNSSLWDIWSYLSAVNFCPDIEVTLCWLTFLWSWDLGQCSEYTADWHIDFYSSLASGEGCRNKIDIKMYKHLESIVSTFGIWTDARWWAGVLRSGTKIEGRGRGQNDWLPFKDLHPLHTHSVFYWSNCIQFTLCTFKVALYMFQQFTFGGWKPSVAAGVSVH